MGTRSKVADELIMKQLRDMSAFMLTKQHFDNEMKEIKDKLAQHDTRITDVETRLDKVESTNIENASEMYEELYEQEVRKKQYYYIQPS